MMTGLSIYGVVVISQSLCSGFYGISVIKNVERASTTRVPESRDFHVRGTE